MEEENSSEECSICLQSILYPVKLPCSHEFCYLCIKGIRDSTSVKRCAICRSQFSLQQIEETLEFRNDLELTKFKWFYESRSDGWWAFDENSSNIIEQEFNKAKDNTLITIAGYIYVIDFVKMQQYRQDTPNRIRKIKREEDPQSKIKIKGVAGLRVSSEASTSHETPIDLTSDDTDTLSQTLSDVVIIDDDGS